MTDMEAVVVIVGMICGTIFLCFIAWLHHKTEPHLTAQQDDMNRGKK